MKSPKNIQIIVIFGVISLTVLLYIANKKGKPVKKEMPKLEASAAVNIEALSDSVIQSLDKENQALVNQMKLLSNKSQASFDSPRLGESNEAFE